jgi:transcriptional regulator with XRE-family HTH domain
MRLKSLREDHDYTQKYIANLLHCKQNTYSQYENGVRPLPIHAMKILAQLYNTSIDYLLDFTDEIKPYKRK